MRKSILTTALILGGFGVYADSFNFKTFNIPVELINGETIEVTIKQELPIKDEAENLINISENLSKEVMNHEKMLQLLNQIRKVEKEVDENLPI